MTKERLTLPERITETHAFFWGSPFSNWFSCEFEWMGSTFQNSEAALMYAKAAFFGDWATVKKILSSSDQDPETMKALGRAVTPYDDAAWAAVRYEFMVDILVAKFSSSPSLLKFLENYAKHHIVEGSPYDGIWGVKLHWSNDLILNSANWGGLNLLGKALMMAQVIFGMRETIPA